MKKVTLKIVNEAGHSTLLLEPKQALQRVGQETEQNGRWCYVDGIFRSFDTLTESDLMKATEITIVNALLGGN